MAIKQWSPWQDLENLQHQISDILGDVGRPILDAREGQWIPRVDIHETDEALVLQAELPGMKKEDVKLEVKDGTLLISGERRYEKDVKEERVHRIERSYGSFSRSFNLPRNINADAIEARMSDGVLHVQIPKLESAKPKAIAIE